MAREMTSEVARHSVHLVTERYTKDTSDAVTDEPQENGSVQVRGRHWSKLACKYRERLLELH
eukprot:4522805-Amphidinium_carterae.1